MKRLKETQRIINIENKWKTSVETLLYNWHWNKNLMHREIGQKLSIPRPTITRWFKQFSIPSQNPYRIVKFNLLNVGSRKGPRAKPKAKSEPRFFVNEKFFQRWSPEMAYVLGYFAADGDMSINPQGSRYIAFISTDYNLLCKIQRVMDSKHHIGLRKSNSATWKNRYRFQIGSKKIFQDLIDLDLTPNKSKSLQFPKIPKEHLSHFIRGYFDGDGCVSFGFYKRPKRKNFTTYLLTRFTSGSKLFLKNLFNILIKNAELKGGSLYKGDRCFRLTYSTHDSLRLYKFMYSNVTNRLYLKRKYSIFQKALSHYGGVV